MKYLAISALMICACAAGAADNDNKDKGISVDQLPAAVKTTVDKEAGTSGIKSVTKEKTKEGKDLYEVKIKVENGKDRTIYVNEDGSQAVREH